MKKTYFPVFLPLFISALFCFTNAQSQKSFLGEEVRVSWHSRTSLMMANIDGDYAKRIDKPIYKPGLSAGGFMRVELNDYLSVEPGVNFSVKGSRTKVDNTTVITTSDYSMTYAEEGYDRINLYYVEWPLMVTYRFESGLLFGAGPYFGLLLKSESKHDVTYTQIRNDVVDTRNDASGEKSLSGYEKTDLGFNLMAGCRLRDGLDLTAFIGKGTKDISDPKRKFNNIQFGLSLQARLQIF